MLSCTRTDDESPMTRNPDDTWTSDALQNGDIAAIRDRVRTDPTYLGQRDYIGNTPLLTAIGFGIPELVAYLLEQGSDPNVLVDDGYTCLLTAVESEAPQSVEIVAHLIKAGADIHHAGTNGWTALHMAAARGHPAKTQLLIDAGADVNCRTNIDGDVTPLMEAASVGRPDTVRLLLKHGADASLRDIIHNRNALEMAEYAAAGPDPNVYKFLKEEQITVDVDELFNDLDVPAEQLESLKEIVRDLDMAETYVENVKDIVASGDHAEVIRILTEHAVKGSPYATERRDGPEP